MASSDVVGNIISMSAGAAGSPMSPPRPRGRRPCGPALLLAADTIEHLFVVPSPSVHRIQEVQTTTYHVLWELTKQALG